MLYFLVRALGTSGPIKLVSFFFLNNRGKLSIIGCDKYLSSMASKPIYIRWIRTLRNTEKSCLSSYSSQISTNIKIKIIKLILNFLARALGTSGPKKLVLFVDFFILNNRGKLSIIRCDKYLFQYGFQTDLYPLD